MEEGEDPVMTRIRIRLTETIKTKTLTLEGEVDVQVIPQMRTLVMQAMRIVIIAKGETKEWEIEAGEIWNVREVEDTNTCV